MIANIYENFGDNSSLDYGSLMVRGKELSFSLGSINAFYDTDSLEDFQVEQDFDKITRALTRKEMTRWVDKNLPSTEMSTKFFLLYGIAIKNWFSNLHRGSVSKFMGQVLICYWAQEKGGFLAYHV